MTLVRLLFTSRSTPDCNLDDIRGILEVAREKNMKRGISGILFYDPKYFIQWLEGPRRSVNALYADILKDSRHQDVTILDYQEVDARSFGKWSVAYVSARKTDQSILFKYSSGTAFDPFGLSSRSAVKLIFELADANEAFLSESISDDDH